MSACQLINLTYVQRNRRDAGKMGHVHNCVCVCLFISYTHILIDQPENKVNIKASIHNIQDIYSISSLSRWQCSDHVQLCKPAIKIKLRTFQRFVDVC